MLTKARIPMEAGVLSVNMGRTSAWEIYLKLVLWRTPTGTSIIIYQSSRVWRELTILWKQLKDASQISPEFLIKWLKLVLRDPRVTRWCTVWVTRHRVWTHLMNTFPGWSLMDSTPRTWRNKPWGTSWDLSVECMREASHLSVLRGSLSPMCSYRRTGGRRILWRNMCWNIIQRRKLRNQKRTLRWIWWVTTHVSSASLSPPQ